MKGLPRGRLVVAAVIAPTLIYLAINFGGSGYKRLAEHTARLSHPLLDLSVTTARAASAQQSGAKLAILDLTVPIRDKFVRSVLQTSRGETPIFVYDLKSDLWVSGAILKSGVWEGGMVTMWQNFLATVPNATAVDVGANLGQYGLAALVMKRPAVFVEPVLRNAKRIVKSIQTGPPDFRQNSIVLQNALSDTRRHILFRTFKGNVGGTQILDERFKQHSDPSFGGADTVLLNDLVGIVPGTNIVMKIDAECSEKQALGKSDRFFARYKVHLIMMEWHRCSSDTNETMAFIATMAKRGFKPYRLSVRPKPPLDVSKARTGWPGDILWVNERFRGWPPKLWYIRPEILKLRPLLQWIKSNTVNTPAYSVHSS